MTTVSNEQADSVSAGLWGGDQISMEVTGSGASIEYGCAHGSINQPIKLDGNGNFSVRGTHVKERPGPVREGESGGVQVTYTGHVDGTTMTLTVTATANKQTIGTYTLTHGKRSRVFKCQ